MGGRRLDNKGSGGLQVVTMILILRREQYASYNFDVWTVVRTGLFLGALTLPDKMDAFLFSSRRRHTRFLNVTEVQTCALPMRRFFFFKQKTAYEISECDWSSDVCSSD